VVPTRLHCIRTTFAQDTEYFVMERASKSPLRELDIRMTGSGYLQISQGFNIYAEPPAPRIFIHPSQLKVIVPTLQAYQREFDTKDSPDGHIKENHDG
jgi:hypothetical protein